MTEKIMIDRWKSYCGGSTLLAWLTLCEAAIWLAVTILTLAGRVMHFQVPVADWLTLPSSFPIFISRPWTLISYMAIHFDVLHMLFNVLWLYWFGRIMLISLSDRQLAFAFAGGGIAGGIFFLIAAAAGYGSGWLCGCSAAVIAVMCTAAIMNPDYNVSLFLIGNVRLKWVATICCLLTFLGGGGNQAAHIGGLAWGVIFAMLLRKGKDLSAAPATLIGGLRPSGKDSSARRSPGRMVEVLKERQHDLQRLDMLLDKIKLSGYGSLSRKERKELNDLSAKLNK
ncbi:MAG: rhomboid family intramembrane serine protease [Muribaculaceae bacterium]|nr:rhomboid family intramembrane serine protease [Muribaculaceae bacterium]